MSQKVDHVSHPLIVAFPFNKEQLSILLFYSRPIQQLIQLPGFLGALVKLLLTKGPDLYTSHKGNRSRMYFLRTPGLCPHSSPRNTGKAVYFLPCLKAEQDLDKGHFPKPNSAMLSWNKGHWSFTRISFSSQFLSIKEGKVTLCLSITDISPCGKAEYQSSERTHDTQSAENCKHTASTTLAGLPFRI